MNPEGVKQAILETWPKLHPLAISRHRYNADTHIFYVLNGVLNKAYTHTDLGDLVEACGTEIFPKKQEKVEFVEKVMYQRIYLNFGTAYVYEDDILYKTIEEATNSKDAVGYREVKIMMKKD